MNFHYEAGIGISGISAELVTTWSSSMQVYQLGMESSTRDVGIRFGSGSDGELVGNGLHFDLDPFKTFDIFQYNQIEEEQRVYIVEEGHFLRTIVLELIPLMIYKPSLMLAYA